jgi:predicted esterase
MTDSNATPLVRNAPATVRGRYVVRPPGDVRPAHHLIGFHGYAQTAEVMLAPFALAAPGADWLVVSVQALHLFYAGRTRDVVASWMTRLDREHAIAANVEYVDAVVEQLDREFGAPRTRVFAGFSQGVGMAHRAAVLGRARCDGVVTLGGDVPPELLAAAPRAWPPVLAMTGDRDEWMTPDTLERDVERLRATGAVVDAFVFEGGHEWSGAAAARAAAWLDARAAR